MAEEELTEEQMLDLLIENERDREWIQKKYEELKKKYANSYIIVHNRKIIKSDSDIDRLLQSEGLPKWFVCEYILPDNVAMLL
ncbi:MAG: hypothetical protein JSW28_09645 [Thermoplasmata archaeon]|nr:MAG: hypothetical protein JSW28_09645 [Thermoplasmata archaeon]